MKSQKLIALEKILRWMSVKMVRKYNPKIIAVTGSVGKTTTKEMISAVLSSVYSTRKNEKNYNNEIGAPLTIIGASSGDKSIIRWLGVFIKWLKRMVIPSEYPQILILEMGADRPGDIKYLCSFIPVDVGVITNIGISHLEHFKTRREVAREKTKLVKSLPTGGLAVLNFDDSECKKVAGSLKANVLGYGLAGDAPLRASDIRFSYEPCQAGEGQRIDRLGGVHFKLNYQGRIIPVQLKYCLGKPHIYSALAAFSVATYFNMNFVDVAKVLENIHPYPGRMSLVNGIKNTAIIDDTYNSAPDSVRAAIEAFKQVKARRKIAVLGDMLELGPENLSSHQEAGRLVAESGADLFVTVGKRMHDAAMEYTRLTNRADLVIEFDSPSDAGLFIQDILKEGDLVLVKGSQGMRMEKIVEEIMDEPDKKGELLVRQDKKWLEREYQQP